MGSPVTYSRPLSVTVIGAGVIGTACALQLARAGVSVRLVDPDAPGSGCSSGNAGSISEDAVVPMALPGMAAKIPGWLADPEGPLHVRWHHLPRALPWLCRWLLASRAKTVESSADALQALLSGAVDGYASLLGKERFLELVRRRGQLIVWESAEPSRSEVAGHALREQRGVAMRWLSPGEIGELEPHLQPIFRRGLLLENHGQLLDPHRAVTVMAEELRARGGMIDRGRVTTIAPLDDGAVVTFEDGSSQRSDRVIVAAGAWSAALARQVGVRVPLETERGYHAMIRGAADLCARPVMHGDRSFFASPMHEGLRIAGTVEIAGLYADPDYRRALVLLLQAQRMFRREGLRADSYWMGRRPSLPDSLPVIGPAPQTSSVVFAFGHGHLGMTGAPATARIVCDLVLGRRASVDLKPFRADRF